MAVGYASYHLGIIASKEGKCLFMNIELVLCPTTAHCACGQYALSEHSRKRARNRRWDCQAIKIINGNIQALGHNLLVEG